MSNVIKTMDRGRVTGKSKRVASLFASVILALGILAMVPPPAKAATFVPCPDPDGPPTPPPAAICDPAGATTNARWGERTVAPYWDYNDDDVADLWVSQPEFSSGLGKVVLLSGASLTANGPPVVLLTITSPASQTNARFGFWISVPGDLTGDTVPDIVVGTDSQDVGGNIDQGRAWAFDGSDGDELYAMDNPYPQSFARFGSRIGRAGDINADGVPDILVGASNNDVPPNCGNAGTVSTTCHKDQGQAFIFNGTDGVVLRQLDLPPLDAPTPCPGSACGSFGLSVQGPGDVDNDGVDDQLVGAPSLNGLIGAEYVFDGALGGTCGLACHGVVYMKVNAPVQQPAQFFGFQDVTPLAPGNVDGVPGADVYGEGWLQDAATVAQGVPYVFHNAAVAGKAVVHYAIVDPHPVEGGQYGWSMTAGNNGLTPAPNAPVPPVVCPNTTIPALYVGASPHFIPKMDQNGQTALHNATNGLLCEDLPLPQFYQQSSSEDSGPNLGWTVSAPGDLNGDGRMDYMAGAPFENVNSTVNAGLLFSFFSKPNGTHTNYPYCRPLPDGTPTPPPTCEPV